MLTVEQGHCTLAAVKRYWDTPCVGGRHNFFRRPSPVFKNKEKALVHKQFPPMKLFMQENQTPFPGPITQFPLCRLYNHPSAYVVHLPGRGVSLIKKGLRLVWSRVIAL